MRRGVGVGGVARFGAGGGDVGVGGGWLGGWNDPDALGAHWIPWPASGFDAMLGELFYMSQGPALALALTFLG